MMTTHESLSLSSGPFDASKNLLVSERNSIRSLTRALDLLELLALHARGLRLVDISKVTNVPTSTAHRLLTTLEERNFVHFDKDSRCWNVGSRCLAVGAAFARSRNLVSIATPVMRQLHDQSQQTINLARTDQRKMTLVAQLPGQHAPTGLSLLGLQSELNATALGQSVMAALPVSELARALQEIQPDVARERELLANAISETRIRRFAVDDDKNAMGLRCVAAPIFDEFSFPIAALSIVGSTQHMKTTQLGDIGRTMLGAAAQITQAIGGRAPLSR